MPPLVVVKCVPLLLFVLYSFLNDVSSFAVKSSTFPFAGRRVPCGHPHQSRSCGETSSPRAPTSTPTLSSTMQDPGADVATSSGERIVPGKHYDSVVVGGGPAGLLSAIMLSRKYGPGHRVAVYERRSEAPPSPDDGTVWSDVARFYLLGLGHRGQSALRRFGVYDDFERASVAVKGRRDWKPGMTREEDSVETPARKDVTSRVLARDKLVGVLHHHILKNYQDANIDLLYGYQVDPISFGDEDGEDDIVKIRISRCEDASAGRAGNDPGIYLSSSESEQLCDVESSEVVSSNLLIAAEGSARTVANAMEQHDANLRKKLNPLAKLFAPSPFKVTRYEDDNQRVYKSVPIKIPAHWSPNLNYSARSRDNRITLEALPSDEKGNICALLLMRPDDELAKANSDPRALRAFFDAEFPCFSALVDDEAMARVAAKSSSNLPAFRFVGPRLNQGGRTVVLGDSAHTVKPYYGLGANTALEDVSFLSDALDDAAADGGDVPAGVRLFSKRRAGDAEALVRISRGMDRPGKMGTALFFVVPLVLDSVFHKMAPALFGPNMFAMFQKQGMGFRQIQRKKRLDRAMQVLCIGSGLAGLGVAAKASVAAVARALGKSQMFVSGSMAALFMLCATLQKVVKKQEPEVQPS